MTPLATRIAKRAAEPSRADEYPVGPHGVVLIPRHHTKSHTGRSYFEKIAKLKAEVEANAWAERDRADRNAQRRESRGGVNS